MFSFLFRACCGTCSLYTLFFWSPRVGGSCFYIQAKTKGCSHFSTERPFGFTTSSLNKSRTSGLTINSEAKHLMLPSGSSLTLSWKNVGLIVSDLLARHQLSMRGLLDRCAASLSLRGLLNWFAASLISFNCSVISFNAFGVNLF